MFPVKTGNHRFSTLKDHNGLFLLSNKLNLTHWFQNSEWLFSRSSWSTYHLGIWICLKFWRLTKTFARGYRLTKIPRTSDRFTNIPSASLPLFARGQRLTRFLNPRASLEVTGWSRFLKPLASLEVIFKLSGSNYIGLILKILLKPTISSLDQKCVGGAKSHGQFWNQWVRLAWFDTKNRPLWSFRGQNR